ncbi:MAG: YjbH domain-containing protein [Candidatus Acidulodesulfobacterium sp.]
MKKFYLILGIYAFFLFAFFPCNSFAANKRFITPTNSGFTGILAIPDAYTLPNNIFRIGFSMEDPYRKFYMSYGLLPNLEITFLQTEIMGVDGLPGVPLNQYGYYKDKLIDFKYMFLKGSKFLPSLALGINDPVGNRLYASQYIVASKELYPFDFSIGFGNGWYGTEPLPPDDNGFGAEIFTHPRSWLRQAMPFWGIQFMPSKKFGLEIAYDPTEYQNHPQDPADKNFFNNNKPVPSKYDFGVIYKPWNWLEMIASYQRGNTLSFNIAMPFDVYKPLIHIFEKSYPNISYGLHETFREKIMHAMRFYGFSNIGILIKRKSLYLQMENNNFFSDRTAALMAIKTLAAININKINTAHIIIEDNYVPILEASGNLRLINALASSIKGEHEINRFVKMHVENNIHILPVETKDNRIISYKISPSFAMSENDLFGRFQYTLGGVAYGIVHPWTGGSIIAGVGANALDNVKVITPPLSIPVRSDMPYYMQRRLNLNNLMFQQTHYFNHGIYGKVSAGLLEYEYGGVNAQIAKVFAKGDIILELGGSIVKKRSVDNPFGFGNVPDETPLNHYDTYFLTTVFNFKRQGMSLKIKNGRFLAGDYGSEFFLSKYLPNGIKFTGFVSLTNTNMFTDRFNRGYHNFGVEISIPLRIFTGIESKTDFSYSATPWDRDVAQDIGQYLDLSDFLTNKIFVDKK